MAPDFVSIHVLESSEAISTHGTSKPTGPTTRHITVKLPDRYRRTVHVAHGLPLLVYGEPRKV